MRAAAHQTIPATCRSRCDACFLHGAQALVRVHAVVDPTQAVRGSLDTLPTSSSSYQALEQSAARLFARLRVHVRAHLTNHPVALGIGVEPSELDVAERDGTACDK